MHQVDNPRVRKRRRKLYNLTAQEVSLVDEPANQRRILVLKGQRSMDAATQVKAAIAGVDAAVITAADALVDSLGAEPVQKAAPAPPPMQGVRAPAPPPGMPTPRPQAAPVPIAPQGGGLSEQAQAALKAVARILAPYANEITFSDLDALQTSLGMVDDEGAEDAPPPAAAAPAQRGTVNRATNVAKAKSPKAADEENDIEDPEEEDAEAAATDDGAKAPKEKGPKKGFMGMGDTRVKKSADGEGTDMEDIFKRAAALEAANEELVQKSAKLEAALEVEREDRLNREYLAKAQGYKHLGDTEALAKVFKSMHGAPEAERVQFEAVLKAADARVRDAGVFGGSLLGSIGSSQSSGSTSAEAKLDALVDGVVQKSASNETREQVYAKVIRSPEGRALYRQSQEEKGMGVH